MAFGMRRFAAVDMERFDVRVVAPHRQKNIESCPALRGMQLFFFFLSRKGDDGIFFFDSVVEGSW